MMVLGPGVIAATTANRRNARACSVVVPYLRMRAKEARSGGEGLERSCPRAAAGWIASRGPAGGVEVFHAWFAGAAYQKRRHELEAITGLTRCERARQFRIVSGTSPYRHLLMRRLDFARERIHCGLPLVEAACEAGFADQAHFIRAFKPAFGLTPGRYRALRAA